MERLFLDANILVSAALKPDSRLAELWTIADVRLLASPHVLAEARRNAPAPNAAAHLERLIAALKVLPMEPADFEIEDDPELPAKDRPVLLAAIVSRADILVTGEGGIHLAPPPQDVVVDEERGNPVAGRDYPRMWGEFLRWFPDNAACLTY
ncbi:MAG: PIN domain-containing protein, partial [Actinomycetota bacterium]|nr:PIN domain-containing protein [Actinomycetota bacterium]